MKLLLEGRLSPNLQIKDLLTGIFQAEASGLSVLRFAYANKAKGELYFLGGHYIVYARLPDRDISGTVAIDELMQLKEADFVYYACDALNALPPNDNLKIDLKQLLDIRLKVSDAPAKPLIVADELLDKIFNVAAAGNTTHARLQALQAVVEEAQSVLQSESKEQKEKQTEAIETSIAAATGVPNAQSTVPFSEPFSESSAQQTVEHRSKQEITGEIKGMDWDLVEPLVSGGAPQADVPPTVPWQENITWTEGIGRHEDVRSTQELRTILGSTQWQRQLRVLILVLVLFILASSVILCCAWLLINMPSQQFTPKRYTIPPQNEYSRPRRMDHRPIKIY